MFELWISPKNKPSAAAKLWPENLAPTGFVRENADYFLEVRGSGSSEFELSIDGLPLLPLRAPTKDTGRWLWNPGFYAGTFTITATENRRTAFVAQVTTDPDLAKLTRDEFDWMVSDILSGTMALFSISHSRRRIARGSADDRPPLARLEFLRSRLGKIERIIRLIDQQPVRVLTSDSEVRRTESCRSIAPGDLARSFRSNELIELPEQSEPLNLLPRKLRVTTRRSGLDIREHRAIKSQLTAWAAWLRVAAKHLSENSLTGEDQGASRLRDHWARECHVMANRLTALTRLPFLDGIPDVREPIAISPIMRWVAPYREFYSLYRDFSLGLAKIQGDFLDMPLARTFDLYELWVFIRLVVAAKRLTGKTPPELAGMFIEAGDGVKIIAGAISLSFGNFTLCFKRAYREYWHEEPNKPGSFSRPMIPDLSISADSNGLSLVVLDAKYRIDSALNDAVASLHTYRDAIIYVDEAGAPCKQAVRGAYVLTPAVPSSIAEDWRTQRAPGVLFHPNYRQQFKFGAMSLRPGVADAEVSWALNKILQDSGILQ